MVFIKDNEKTKEELLKAIEELCQKITDLEKLQNEFQKVKKETGEYPNPSEESFKTYTFELTKANEQLQQEIIKHPKAEDSLQECDKNFKEIISAVLDAVIIIDGEGRIIFWNKGAEKIFDYSQKEVLGKPLTDILISPEYHEAFKEGFNKFKKTGKNPIIVGKIVEFITKKKDGIRFSIEMSLSAIKINEKWHLVATIRDITESKIIEEKLKQSCHKLEEMVNNTVYGLGKIIEIRDSYTSGHQKRVSELAVAIARELGIPKEKIELVKIAALVHDIGKVSIPMEILNKPDRLAKLEYRLIKTHSQTGHDILRNIKFPWAVEEIVLQHHEKIDGSGYPRGLTDDEILIEAKIIAVADVVEAMSSHRPYRPAHGIKKALEEISQNKGILYDPEIADTCLKLFRDKKFKF